MPSRRQARCAVHFKNQHFTQHVVNAASLLASRLSSCRHSQTVFQSMAAISMLPGRCHAVHFKKLLPSNLKIVFTWSALRLHCLSSSKYGRHPHFYWGRWSYFELDRRATHGVRSTTWSHDSRVRSRVPFPRVEHSHVPTTSRAAAHVSVVVDVSIVSCSILFPSYVHTIVRTYPYHGTVCIPTVYSTPAAASFLCPRPRLYV